MMRILVVLVALVFVGAVLLWSGAYNVAADDPHTRVVHRLIEVARDRSIASRSAAVQVPDLSTSELIRKGAGNYSAMCEECHLKPGLDDSEVHRGLYPQPPNLAVDQPEDPAEAFWIIKHGLKATGMPAWGRSMDDETIWGMVAFLRWLPGRTAAEYEAAVAASSGHSHDGAEEEAEHSHEAAARESGPVAQSSPAEREVISALEEYHASLTSGDIASVERHVMADERFVMIEGDHVNRGWADYRDHHLRGELADLRKVRFRLSVNQIEQEDGLAYVDFGYHVLPREGPEKDFGKGQATAILVRTDAGWKIRLLHTS